jgi:hypothetical protein
MSGVNVQISMTNLTQVDRHQSDIHRLPGTHQEQNAALLQNAAHRRIAMPVEPDEIEKKSIDTNDKRQSLSRKKMKKRKSEQKRNPLNDPDHQVDLQA